MIENADEIGADTEYTFCVFRVGIGRSYCHPTSNDDIESIPLKEGYDSVFLDQPN